MEQELLTGMLGALIAVLVNWLRTRNRWSNLRAEQEEREQTRIQALETKLEKMQEQREAIWAEERERLNGLILQTEDNYRGEIAKLNRALEAIETARNADLERYGADRREWEQERRGLEERLARMEREAGQRAEELAAVRADLKDAEQRIQEMEVDRARVKAQNQVYMEHNQALLGVLKSFERWLPQPPTPQASPQPG